MSKAVSVKLSGFDELARDLQEAPIKASREIMRTGLKKAGLPWQQEMQARVEKGPHHYKGKKTVFGFISKNIGLSTGVNSEIEGWVRVGPKKKGFWAYFLEFGTRHMRPFPFARASGAARANEVLDAFKAAVQQALAAAGLRGR